MLPKSKGAAGKRRRLRKKANWAKHYGSKAYLAAIHGQPCEGCGSCTDLEASHLTSKGAGGTWRDVVSKCKPCHLEWHQIGRLVWCQRHGVTLERMRAIAVRNVGWFGRLVEAQ